MGRARRSRKLEDAGQLRLDLQAATPWNRRMAGARQLPLDLRPGADLERRYRAWLSPLEPGRVVVAFRKRGAIFPVTFRGISPGFVLARLRRGSGERQLIASRWRPWAYFSTWLDRAS